MERIATTVTHPYLEICNLKKRYALKPILRGIDLQLQRGQRMALLGANGSGKTTLLRMLAGLTKADTGSIWIAGLKMSDHAQAIRALVGFVAHQPYLYDELTAFENLKFFGQMYNVEHAQERAMALLRVVGLERRAHERVSTFSRGLVQRLAWARALLHSPTLLLLDEPETGLDQEGNILAEHLLTAYTQQGGTVLFTTHQLERALQLSDQIVMLANGRIAYQCEARGWELEGIRRTYQEVVQ